MPGATKPGRELCLAGLSRGTTTLAEKIDRKYGWDKLPLPLATAGPDRAAQHPAREEPLRHRPRAARQARASTDHPRYLTARTLDGTYNDLDDPLMGSLGSRFGRNVPLEYTVPEPDQAARAEPAHGQPRAADARGVPSRRRRSTCSPARGSSSRSTTGSATARTSRRTRGRSPLDDDDPWPEHPMQIQRTRRDPSADADGPPTFVNDDTHWWDGSQIYGSDAGVRRRRSAPASTASCSIDDRGPARRRSSRRTSTSPASPATSGSGSRSCTRSSCASTTRSATTCTRRTRSCRTTSSTTRRGSSSRR